MIKNKKIFYTLIILTVAILGLTTAAAVNTENNTNNHDDTLQQSTNTLEIQEIQNNKEINKKQQQTTKKATTKTITNQTYTNYFKNSTTSFIPQSQSISEGDTIDLSGRFENMDFVIDKKNIKFTSTNKNAQLYNCTVYIQNTATDSTISNLQIYNTNKENATGIFVNYTNNLLIENNHVIVDDCSYSFAFAGSLNNSIIRSNNFKTLSTNTERTHTCFVMGKSHYNLITNNTVYSDEANGIYISSYGSGRFIMAGAGSNNNITSNNVSGGDGTWVNLIQTTGNNNKIDSNNVTGGYEGIVVLGGNAIITNNQVNGPKQYGMDIQDDGSLTNTNTIISNNNITVTDNTDAIRVFKNTQINNNNINSENGYDIYIESGEDCANFNITSNNITSTNSTGIYTKGIANHIRIEDNKINTKQEGIKFAQQSITKRPNNILVNNNNITTQTEYAINFNNAGSRTASQINITVTDTNILTSTRGTGLHTSYLPPTNNQTIPQVRTQIQINPIAATLEKPVNITATITARDSSTINNGNITFTDDKGQQIATAPIINNQSTITTTFTDYSIKQITATYNETENYTTSQNTTTINITTNTDDYNKDELLELIQRLEEENNNLKQSLLDNQTKINQLNTENEELKQQLQQYNNTITNQTQTIKAQEEKIAELTDKINNMNKTVNNQNQKIQEQNIQINTLNNTINALTQENSNLKNNITQQENIIKTQNDKINNLNTQINVLNKTINEQEQQIQEYNNTIKTQNTQINTLNNQITDINNEINNLNTQITQLTKTINEQEQQIQEYKNTIKTQNTQINTLNNKITDINKEITNKNNEINDLNGQTTQLTKTINEQEQQLQRNNNTIQAQQNTINQQNQENKQLTNTNNNLNQTIKELTTNQNVKLTQDQISKTKYSNNIKIIGTLKDNNKKPLNNQIIKIKINNQEKKVITNKNGIYALTTKATIIGTNNITIQYEKTDKYNSSTTKTTFQIEKMGLNIKLDNIKQVKYGDNTTITGRFSDDNNKGLINTVLRININGQTIKIKTGLNGTFTYTTQTNKTGTNNITISYPGNKNYKQVTSKTTFKVTKQDVTININEITPVKYGDNTIITGTLTDKNNRKIKNTQVTIKINNKAYTAKTDVNGKYKLTIKTANVGKNNITVSFNGNTYYNKTTIRSTFTTNKQNIRATLNTLQNKNYKTTIKGKLSDVNNNPLKNSNIKISINGKTKTIKTDNKGIFTYTANVKQKQIKFTLTFPGNVKYTKYTKTTLLNFA
ncbi:Ig-like domain repeat protein [Methanosphaera sp. ISO3-F5]|uniref:Ig-like domain repeat protein n=1 Tax=Methanosphaera sp. ISO3-F5 TaxID=1452353 RepID=UPI002B25AA5C|nr:Ig-like domain repeat protein [Methanosphaera sp. ISO3-F5]WQH64279.1 hypothetical protein PXD04_00335 [Methanosphaera sp. ISO3-F5]